MCDQPENLMRHGFQLCIDASPDGVGKANAAFTEFAETHAVPDSVRRPVQVAIDELLANELSHGTAGHGSGSVTIEVTLDQDRMSVTLASDGPPFDPFSQEAPDTSLPVEQRPIGGLGLHLVQKLMDEVRYERRDEKNLIHMIKLLSAGTQDDQAEAG